MNADAVGWSEPRQSENSKLIERADQAEHALKADALSMIKGGPFTVCGVPKGKHEPVEIWPALLDTARIISWSKSGIAASGGRRFDCVRVLSVTVQSPPPAPIVGANERSIVPPTIVERLRLP